MAKMKKFERSLLKEFRADVQQALAGFAELHGLVLDTNNGGTFGDTNYEFKVKFAVKGENGEVLTQERQDFKQYATSYRLKPEWLGKSFTYQGRSYTITGLNTHSRRHPVVCDDNTRQSKSGFSTSLILEVMEPKDSATAVAGN